MKRCWHALAMFALLWPLLGSAQELPEGLTCPVSNEPVDSEVHRPYREGKVYFCCEDCAATFEEDHTEYATAANRQLAKSEQYRQKACPISGKPMKDDVVSEIDGLQIGMCCPMCKKKVDNASPAEKEQLVFADEPFEKAFEKAADEKAADNKDK